MARQSKTKQREQKRLEANRKRQQETRQRGIRNLVLAVVGGAVVVGGLFMMWPRQSEAEAAADAASTFGAESWDLPELDGNDRVRIEDFRGKPTVAVFFANWCEVCEREMPEMFALSQQIGDRVNFVGVDMMDNGGGLGDATRWGVVGVWPLARDVGNGNGSTLAAGTFGARGSPLHVIYDDEGQIIFSVNRGMTSDEVVSVLQANGQL
jgi:thiol-disulfide isomerase/thioredoxin